jgi:peptidoglycan/LPS O-acetylase OafA/YrhL
LLDIFYEVKPSKNLIRFNANLKTIHLCDMSASNSNYFPALTGIRALAAYLVFFHHFFNPEKVPEGVYLPEFILGEMHIGVTFFFVLSGFLIHNRYVRKFESGLSSFKSYFFSRVARIMPLFLVVAVLTFIVIPFFKHVELLKWIQLFLLNISLLKGFSDATKFSGVYQSWSLTVEFCFYTLAPVLFFLFRNQVKRYLLLSLFFLIFCFAATFFKEMPSGNWIGDLHFFLGYTFFGRSFEFFAGCFLSSRLNNWKNFTGSIPVYTMAGSAGIVFSIFCLTLLRSGDVLGDHHPIGIGINNFLLPVFIVAFFRGLILETSFFQRFLYSRIMQLLGKSSYAFYLIHIGIFESLISFINLDNRLVSFFLLNIIAIFLNRFVEEPAQIRLQKWFSFRYG